MDGSASSRETCFERLYRAHVDAVYRYALRREPAAADDIVADAFLAAWRRLDDIPAGMELPWLLGAARRSHANARRGTRRRQALTERLRGTATREHDIREPSTTSMDPAVEAALACLPARDKELLMLVAWDGLDTEGGALARTWRCGCTAPASASCGSWSGWSSTRRRRIRKRRKADMRDSGIARLKQADPARGAALPRSHKEALLERLLDADLTRESAPARRGPRGRLAVRPVSVGLSVLVAFVVAATVLFGGGAREGGVATAAAALREAAAVARAQPPTPVPGAGQYLYVKVRNVPVLALASSPPFARPIRSRADYGFSVAVPNVQETWQGPDGGRQRISNEPARFPTAGDRQAWIAAGRPELPGGDVLVHRLGDAEPLDLPTDPDALYERLEREAADRGSARHAYMFGALVGDTLSEWRASPAQRAALLDVAARIPGVELLGRRTDPAGREGLAFAMRDEADSNRVTLIIDPDTADLLAKTSVGLPGGPIPAGTVTSTQTYGTPKLVDAIGERGPLEP